MSEFKATNFAAGRIPLSGDELPTIITADMLRPRQCRRCAASYKEFENIGAWKCSAHTSPWDTNSKRYACCGSSATIGCIACDHTETPARPYPGSVVDEQLTFGCPAFELYEGNLKELKGVLDHAIIRHKESEQRALRGVERVTVYIFRQSVYARSVWI